MGWTELVREPRDPVLSASLGLELQMCSVLSYLRFYVDSGDGTQGLYCLSLLLAWTSDLMVTLLAELQRQQALL